MECGVAGRPAAARPGWLLLGPAFVAAIAYVDPGNVAANVSAGAQFGFLLVWVIVVANADGLPGAVPVGEARTGDRPLAARAGGATTLAHRRRIAYWVQAELVAMATDLAEVVGGAIALYLLFDLPLLVGGVITGAVSLLLLVVQEPPRPAGVRAGHHRPAARHRDRIPHQPVGRAARRPTRWRAASSRGSTAPRASCWPPRCSAPR